MGYRPTQRSFAIEAHVGLSRYATGNRVTVESSWFKEA